MAKISAIPAISDSKRKSSRCSFGWLRDMICNGRQAIPGLAIMGVSNYPSDDKGYCGLFYRNNLAVGQLQLSGSH